MTMQTADIGGDRARASQAEASGARASVGSRYEPWEPSLWRVIDLSLRSRRFACKFFAQLDVEYEALCSDEYKAQTAAVVSDLRAMQRQSPNWNLNHRFEHVLLAGLPEPILRQRATLARSRLLALVGAEGTAVYAEAFAAPDPHCTGKELLISVFGVLVELQRLRHVQTEFERFRNRLIVSSLVPGFVFVFLGLISKHFIAGMSLAEIAALFGLIGGYLSVLLRIGSLRWSVRYAANYQQVDKVFWNVFWNFYLSLAEGSLGAIVLYVVFCSGALKQVGIFPDLSGLSPGVTLMGDTSHIVAAQLMLWSVVAGFSERVAPDLLSSLSKEVTRKPEAS